MTPATEQVLHAAMALPEDEQRELVEALLSARTSPDSEADVEAAWDAEAGRRLDEIVAGRAAGRPLDEFLAELRGRRS
jgi:putative addiction module component (TIGR02574 family)